MVFCKLNLGRGVKPLPEIDLLSEPGKISKRLVIKMSWFPETPSARFHGFVSALDQLTLSLQGICSGFP